MKTCLAGVCVLGIVLATRVAGAPFDWQMAKPEEVGLSPQRIEALRAALAAKGSSGLLIIRHDRIVCEWYDGKVQTVDKPHGTASLAKALVGGMSLAAAMDEGKIKPEDLASKYVPQWAGDAKKSHITVAELATHTSGLEDAEQGGIAHEKLTGWKGDFWKRTPDPFTISRDQTPVVLEPGTRVSYSNPGMAMLSYAITSAIRGGEQKDVKALLREKVLRPIGVADKAWNIGYGKPYRVDGLDLYANWGGAAFTARAAARVGRLMMREGDWDGRHVIDARVVREILDYHTPAVVNEWSGASSPRPVLGWYSNVDKTWPAAPRDAFCGAGAGHQVLLVVPSLDLIVVRNGSLMKHPEGFWTGVEKEIVTPLMGAVSDPANPPSDVIRRVRFDDEKSIIRRAIDSDNWPMTWGDDDAIYTAYGDGRGFEPFVETKLSLGLARVEGTPPEFNGVNLRSESAERSGGGAKGAKASGMLMVQGVLYMWVRNTGNATLAWSTDHGRTWTWGFKFSESFGCPTFLNFGRNYEGARDDYVYVYSQDSADAYEPADSAVLARVPRERIREKEAYEFFVRRAGDGKAIWSGRLSERGAVFTNAGRTARLDAVYNAGLKRYLLAVSYGQGKGWGLYEAPQPWGPWATAFSSTDWGLGMTHGYRLPAKWMSSDGRSGWLVFSGTRPNDAFCVRGMMFDLFPPLESDSGH